MKHLIKENHFLILLCVLLLSFSKKSIAQKDTAIYALLHIKIFLGEPLDSIKDRYIRDTLYTKNIDCPFKTKYSFPYNSHIDNYQTEGLILFNLDSVNKITSIIIPSKIDPQFNQFMVENLGEAYSTGSFNNEPMMLAWKLKNYTITISMVNGKTYVIVYNCTPDNLIKFKLPKDFAN